MNFSFFFNFFYAWSAAASLIGSGVGICYVFGRLITKSAGDDTRVNDMCFSHAILGFEQELTSCSHDRHADVAVYSPCSPTLNTLYTISKFSMLEAYTSCILLLVFSCLFFITPKTVGLWRMYIGSLVWSFLILVFSKGNFIMFVFFIGFKSIRLSVHTFSLESKAESCAYLSWAARLLTIPHKASLTGKAPPLLKKILYMSHSITWCLLDTFAVILAGNTLQAIFFSGLFQTNCEYLLLSTGTASSWDIDVLVVVRFGCLVASSSSAMLMLLAALFILSNHFFLSALFCASLLLFHRKGLSYMEVTSATFIGIFYLFLMLLIISVTNNFICLLVIPIWEPTRDNWEIVDL